MTTKILRSTLLVLALAMGACSSSNDTTGKGGSGGSTGSAGSGGSTGTAGGGGATAAAGGGGGGATGTAGAGGAGGSGTPSTIAQCGELSTPKAINDCIINLPTDSVGQTVSFTATADYNSCKM